MRPAKPVIMPWVALTSLCQDDVVHFSKGGEEPESDFSTSVELGGPCESYIGDRLDARATDGGAEYETLKILATGGWQ
jgi:hypothetical protein